MNSLIKSAIIIDKKSEFHNKKVDILIQNGIISDISENIKNPKNFKEISLPNLHVSPGWFDYSICTGEPGYEERDNILNTLNVASKSGLVGLYKSIALEVAKRNINVNVVSPGFISTSMTDKLNDDQKKNYLSRIPMLRFGDPKEVANLVYFLSTDDSSYISGQNIHINGGMLMV